MIVVVLFYLTVPTETFYFITFFSFQVYSYTVKSKSCVKSSKGIDIPFFGYIPVIYKNTDEKVNVYLCCGKFLLSLNLIHAPRSTLISDSNINAIS